MGNKILNVSAIEFGRKRSARRKGHGALESMHDVQRIVDFDYAVMNDYAHGALRTYCSGFDEALANSSASREKLIAYLETTRPFMGLELVALKRLAKANRKQVYGKFQEPELERQAYVAVLVAANVKL